MNLSVCQHPQLQNGVRSSCSPPSSGCWKMYMREELLMRRVRKCWAWLGWWRPSTELVHKVVTCKSLGKRKRWQTREQKATSSWKNKKPDWGKENFSRARAKLEVLFWSLSAPKLPDLQALGMNMVQITPVVRGLRSNWRGSGAGPGGVRVYLGGGRSVALACGRAADSDFMEAIILPAAAARS